MCSYLSTNPEASYYNNTLKQAAKQQLKPTVS